MRHVIAVLGVIGISAALTASPVRAWERDQLPPSCTLGLNAGTAHVDAAGEAGAVLGDRATGSILGVDTIPTFDSYFYDPGFNTAGFRLYTWQYRMVGRAPFKGGEDDNDQGDDGPVTHIRAPIVSVTVDLRDADGSPRFVNGQRLISSPAAYVASTLGSPIFQRTGGPEGGATLPFRTGICAVCPQWGAALNAGRNFAAKFERSYYLPSKYFFGRWGERIQGDEIAEHMK